MYTVHTPEAVFQARLLDNQGGANTDRYVFGKLSARCFQRRTFWDLHYSNCCGDTDHGKSAQVGVIYTVVYVRSTGQSGREPIAVSHARLRDLRWWTKFRNSNTVNDRAGMLLCIQPPSGKETHCCRPLGDFIVNSLIL